MGAFLSSSLDGWQSPAALVSAIWAVFWSFLFVAGFYSPVAAAAPETVPHIGPATREALAVDIWVLIVAIPLAFGLAEGLLTKRRGLALALEVVRGSFICRHWPWRWQSSSRGRSGSERGGCSAGTRNTSAASSSRSITMTPCWNASPVACATTGWRSEPCRRPWRSASAAGLPITWGP